MRALRLAWLSYRRRGWGLFMILIPLAVLFCLVTLLVTLESTIAKLASPGLDDRTIRVATLGTPFPRAVVEKVAKLPGVAEAGAMVRVQCLDLEGKQFPGCWGASLTFAKIFSYGMKVPADVLDRWTKEKSGALIGQQLAERMSWREGQDVQLKLKNGTIVPLKILYVATEGTLLGNLWMNAEYANMLLGSPGTFDPIWVIADSASSRQTIMKTLEETYADSATPVDSTPLEAVKSALIGSSKLLISIYRWAGILAALIVVTMSLTLLILAIDQRRRELATLRAIGYRSGMLLKLILAESVLLILPGALVGASICYLWLHDKGMTLSAYLVLRVGLTTIGWTALISVVLALVAGLIPARRAANCDVLMSLRGE